MLRFLTGLLVTATIGVTTPVWAHTPLCSCFDNGDGTVMCEGGFSDGSTAAGVRMMVKDDKGNVIEEGKMSNTSEFSFSKPSVPYTVLFDGGEGHTIQIKGSDIK